MDNSYICPSCEKKFLNYIYFYKHVKYLHVNNFYFKCRQSKCSRIFQNFHKYINHLKQHKVTCQQMSDTTDISPTVKVNDITLYDNDTSLKVQKDTDVSFCTSDTEITPEIFSNFISSAALKLCCKLYSNYSLPRNIIQTIVTDLNNMYSDTTNILVNSVNCNEQILQEFCEILSNPFKGLESEYKRFKLIENLPTFIKPETIIIGETIGISRAESHTAMNLVNCTKQYISIPKTLQSFLELGNVYMTIKSFVNQLNFYDCLVNIMQGSLWKDIKKKFQNKFVLPLFIYADDIEINNPLGTHSGVQNNSCIWISSLFAT